MFSSYLSNGDESGEKDHENEFKGSKNGGREVWVGLEWPKNGKIRRPKVAAAAVFAGPIRAHPAAADHEISRRWSSGGGQNRLPRLKPEWPENGSKRPSSRSTGFRGIFLVFLGLGTPLACKTRFV